MPAWLTRETHIFRPPLFANLLPFLAGFHDSKIRLNIFAIRGLTMKRCISRTDAANAHPHCFCNINDMAAH
jgi:hypothetical protein